LVEPESASTSQIRLAKASREHVFDAADEILTAGRRPTIEAVQARLGGGSPNSIVAYLKDWYGELGERLSRAQSPAEGLLPEVHQAALGLQRALRQAQKQGLDAQSDDTLLRSLRAEIHSLRLVLDELRKQRASDQQALADARAFLIRREEELQHLNVAQIETVTKVAVLEQRLRTHRAAMGRAAPKKKSPSKKKPKAKKEIRRAPKRKARQKTQRTSGKGR
jgi:hypothetical protein